MKAALAVTTILIIYLWAGSSLAQSVDRFQSLGGEYGRDVISSLTANETEGAASSDNESNSTLWNWGTVPKGSKLVNGTLAKDPFSTPGPIDNPESLFTQVGVDAFTGRAIYSYKPSNSAVTKYFYIDPYTRLPVYMEWNDFVADTASTTGSGSESYALPSAFR